MLLKERREHKETPQFKPANGIKKGHSSYKLNLGPSCCVGTVLNPHSPCGHFNGLQRKYKDLPVLVQCFALYKFLVYLLLLYEHPVFPLQG